MKKSPLKHNRIKHHSKVAEKNVDATAIDKDISEEYRDPTGHEVKPTRVTTDNWSQSQDRGEDLINERDPFTQQPERDSEIPPELIQMRAYHIYEQRGRQDGDNLADWFEAERQLRSETPYPLRTLTES